MLESLYPILPFMVIVVVLGLFLHHFFGLRARKRELTRQLRAAMRAAKGQYDGDKLVQEYKRDTGTEHFFEIDEALKKLDRISHYWQEFVDSFVTVKEPETKKDIRYNTIDAAHFFNREDILETELRTDFTRHAPGIFTATGIVGTFLGIWLGLQKASTELSSSSAEALTKATTSLLNHVGPAFGASFVAVLLAVIFLWYERSCVDESAKCLLDFQQQLDFIFPRKSSEQIMVELSGTAKEQGDVLKSLSTDFGLKLEPLFSRLIENQASNIEKANNVLVEKLAVAIHEKLAPLTTSVSSAAEQLKSDQSEKASGAMESLVQQFSNSLTSGAQQQVGELSATITALAEVLDRQREDMEAHVGRIGRASGEQASLLEKQVHNMVTQASTSQEAILQRLERLFTEQSASLTQHTTKASQEALHALGSAGNDLSAMTQRSINAQETATATLSTTISQLQETVTKQMSALVNSVTQASRDSSESAISTQNKTSERIANIMASTQKSIEEAMKRLADALEKQTERHREESTSLLTSTLNGLRESTTELVTTLQQETSRQVSEVSSAVTKEAEKSSNTIRATTAGITDTVERAMTRLTSQMDTLIAATSNTNNSLLKRFEEQAKLLERLAQQTNAEVGNVTQRLRDGAGQVTNLIEKTRDLVGLLQQHADSTREVNGQLSHASQNLKEAAQNVQGQTTLSQSIATTLAALAQKLREENTALDQRIAAQQALHREFNRLTEALTTGITHQNQAVAEMNRGFERLNASATSYYAKLEDNLNRALGQFDTELTKGTQVLGGAVERLAQPWEDIAGTLEELGKRLGRR